tara:strand:- start:4 stop:264 length:261 start_codon:yes stop_codon:yes gene_type:complete
MSWGIILKKKKINMGHLRKIVDHLLEQGDFDTITISDFNKMVASTYRKYNPSQRAFHFSSILASMLKNRGYKRFEKAGIVYYMKVK